MVQCGSCGNKWKQYPKIEEKILPLKKSKSIKSHSKFSLDIRDDDSGNFEPFPDLTVSSP